MLTKEQYSEFSKRFLPEPNTGCWLWMGNIDKNGYGLFHVDRRARFAHRISYAHFVGAIPDGYTIDHICWIACCVNPQHLEPKTNIDNAKRQRSATKTHCMHGHEFSLENTYITTNGRRDCRSCRRRDAARYQKRLRSEAA